MRVACSAFLLLTVQFLNLVSSTRLGSLRNAIYVPIIVAYSLYLLFVITALN